MRGVEDGDRVRSYRDLSAWQEAVDLAVECYRATRHMPPEERYGLTSQIRRAATSIPANIADGYGRNNTGDYAQFLRVAQGSLKELETHFIVAAKVGLIDPLVKDDILEQCEVVGRRLRPLLRSIETLTKRRG